MRRPLAVLAQGLDSLCRLMPETARIAAKDPIEREFVFVAEPIPVLYTDFPLGLLILVVGRGVDAGQLRKILLGQAPHLACEPEPVSHPLFAPVVQQLVIHAECRRTSGAGPPFPQCPCIDSCKS